MITLESMARDERPTSTTNTDRLCDPHQFLAEQDAQMARMLEDLEREREEEERRRECCPECRELRRLVAHLPPEER